jgi:deazaflavin-dependent oxidoreductase (nitroreductase family)
VSDRGDFNAHTIEEFRANHGHVGGRFEGVPLLLLHHTGAKSGNERVNPLAYMRLEDGVAVFASKGGAPTNPDWYYNLRANPRARVEIGDDTIEVEARVADPDERDRIYEAQARARPQFAAYEEKTTRKIPVVILEPIG